MTISNFQVQYILRAYSRQLDERTRLSKRRKNKGKDTVCEESWRMLIVDRIVEKIMDQFADGNQLGERYRNILEQLSLEYGRTLALSGNEAQRIGFKLLDGKDGKVEYLSTSENERLVKRLHDIVQSTVYNDLMGVSANINMADHK